MLICVKRRLHLCHMVKIIMLYALDVEKNNRKKEIEQPFGYRTMESGNVFPQSHRRECRLKELNNK